MTGALNLSSSDSGPSTSISLLEGARHGSEESWKKLAQVYGPIIYGWARRMGLQAADASDIMQETLLAVSHAIRRFRSESPTSSFRGWLWTITKNKIRDRQRSQQKHPPAQGGSSAQVAWSQLAGPAPESDEDLDHPPSDVADDETQLRLRLLEVLQVQFSPRLWRMFWETAVAGRPPDEVAQEMGTTKWAVYKARARILHKLRQELEELL